MKNINYLDHPYWIHKCLNVGRICQFLPPATKLGQGNIFRSVCQEFCPQGGCLPHCMLGYTPPGPEADTPPPREGDTPGAVHAGIYRQQAGGTHPFGMHTCFLNQMRTS